MTDLDVRAFFGAALASPPPGTLDLDRAVAEGRALLRRRRTRRTSMVAGAALLAGASVAAATVIGRSPYVTVIEPSASMSPTIAVGDSVVLDKRLVPQRLDVVQIAVPGQDVTTLRRVIALPGDMVACPDAGNGTCSAVVVNGVALSTPALAVLAGRPFPTVTVGPGKAFVLGDNRAVAVDSTNVGLFDLASVSGVVVSVAAPGQRPHPVAGAPQHTLDGHQIDPPGAVPTSAATSPH